MDERPEILVTNDDGIDAPGITALRDSLAEIADVTVVAPANDQSKVGRQTSTEVRVDERDCGYAIHGTPVDCVIAGLQEFCLDPDLVVSGVNRGANLGGYVLGRSGTVSAAVEAAFLGVPAIASSLYVPVGDQDFHEVEVVESDYREVVRATSYLVENAADADVFEHVDYLNVNAPPADEGSGPAPMTVTRPSHHYEVDAVRDGDHLRLEDRIWELMAAGDLDEPEGTDRRAVLDGEISVSPLTAPHSTMQNGALDELTAAYAPESEIR